MYNIKKLKNHLPLTFDNYQLDLLAMSEIDWYIDNFKKEYMNRFMDNSVVSRDDMYDRIKFGLYSLVLSYKTGMKISGEARMLVKEKGTDNIVGGCTLMEKTRKDIEIGYWILPEYQGNKICTKLIDAVIEMIKQMQCIDSITLRIQCDNTISQAVANKAGFKHVEDEQGKKTINYIYRMELN